MTGISLEGEPNCKKRIQMFLYGNTSMALTSAIIILSLLQFAVVDYMQGNEYKKVVIKYWVGFTILINSYFLLELILYFLVFKFAWIWKEKRSIYFELLLQTIAIYADTLFLDSYFADTERAISLCCIVFLLRTLRLLHLLTEIRHFKMIIGTFMKFNMSFFTMILTLYTVFFIFTEIGMILFAGKITTNSAQTRNFSTPPLWYLMNFNDHASSFITLFHVMVVNNWYVTVDMYCTVTGNNWPRLFFALFWIFSVCMMLNLVVSFVLEVYSSVVEEISRDLRKRVFINNLKAKVEQNMLEVTATDIMESLPYESTTKLRQMIRTQSMD